MMEPQEQPSPLAGDVDTTLDAVLEREELAGMAQDFLDVLVYTGQHRVLEATVPIPWKVGMALQSDPDEAIRLLALTLALDAVLARPEVILAAVREVYTRLLPFAPRLEFPARTTWAAGDHQPAR
jgi:hypothetical protein